ncbi:ABC transporter ATP-binding protein [Streptacidiphilus sp. 4-A2]|nr:ABC transporter ATP-binding protein [Streptacidiphilus sp. 4-A2]
MLGPFRIPLAIDLALLVADALASLALPILVRHGIDSGVTKKAGAAVMAAALIALIVVVGDWLVEWAETQISGRTGERVLYSLRVKIFAHLQRLGLDYYERELGGRIMTRMTTDVDALSSFLQTGVVTAVVSLLTFIGIFVVLLVLDVRLALYVFAVLPLLVIATVVFRKKSTVSYTLAREKVSTVNADLQENVAGMRIVQAFLREDRNRERFEELSSDYRRTRIRAQLYISLYFPFVQFLSSVAAAVVLIVGANRVTAGTLTAGALVAYLLYIDLFFSRCSSSRRCSTATSRRWSASAGSVTCCARRPRPAGSRAEAGRTAAWGHRLRRRALLLQRRDGRQGRYRRPCGCRCCDRIRWH